MAGALSQPESSPLHSSWLPQEGDPRVNKGLHERPPCPFFLLSMAKNSLVCIQQRLYLSTTSLFLEAETHPDADINSCLFVVLSTEEGKNR